MTAQAKIRTCLWFDDQALPVAEFYVSLLPDSQIDRIGYYPDGRDMAEPGKVLLVEFTLAGTAYQALNGGSHFALDEAVSISQSRPTTRRKPLGCGRHLPLMGASRANAAG